MRKKKEYGRNQQNKNKQEQQKNTTRQMISTRNTTEF